MQHIVKIKSIELITHDVLKIKTDKPTGIIYKPGQAVDISINKPNWINEFRAFTFTSLPTEIYLEFIIKTYPNHHGLTNELLFLNIGDELIIGDVFGDIVYKGEGTFIAGGAGITPFIAILKQLQTENKINNNKLLFANKSKNDIILEHYLKNVLNTNFINILSEEKWNEYEHGFINETIIKKYANLNQYFYLCGPPPMMEAVEKILLSLNVPSEKIIRESF
jgi:benzoate/toluate 1,2-dioxygenase reductase subunit